MQAHDLRRVAVAGASAIAVALAPLAPALVATLASPAPAVALSDEQALVDEAWRVVNSAYVDRSFHNQDWRAVRLNYVKKQYRSKAEAYESVRAMLRSLDDRFTRFLTPAEFDSLTDLARGDVAGIGVELAAGSKGAAAIATDVVPNSPAERGGLKAGSSLLYVDGQTTAGLELNEVASMLRGTVGSVVRVDVAPKGEDAARTLRLTREDIKIGGVASRVASLSDGRRVGIVTIKSFSKDTAADVRAALKGLAPGSSGLSALLLDLRHDPGGYFPGGIDTARLFLPVDSAIVTVVNKDGIGDTFETIEDGIDTSTPLFVAIDPSTASAAEILAGALADNGRATLCGGPKTYGKAKVQTLNQLSDGSGVAVTVSLYLTPSGTDINGNGLPAATSCAVACEYPGDPTACVPPGAWPARGVA